MYIYMCVYICIYINLYIYMYIYIYIYIWVICNKIARDHFLYGFISQGYIFIKNDAISVLFYCHYLGVPCTHSWIKYINYDSNSS